MSRTPAGLLRVMPRASVLATGARERPRPARLVPGDRPSGIYTTGQLQNIVHIHHGKVGTPRGRRRRRTGQLVSGADPAPRRMRHRADDNANIALRSPTPRSTSRARHCCGYPVATRTRIVRVIGKPGLAAVEVENLDTGQRRIIECDTVIFTGDWIPDHELARSAGIDVDPATKGPLVDTALRTSRAGVFAAGNLLHPVDTADIAALDGLFVADQVAKYLDSANTRTRAVPGSGSWLPRRCGGSHRECCAVQTRPRPVTGCWRGPIA